MGEHQVEQGADDRRQRAFMRSLLGDLRALEKLLDAGRIESGVRRIGAEQEMFLVDREMRPAFVAQEVLRRPELSRRTSPCERDSRPTSPVPPSQNPVNEAAPGTAR